MTQRRIVIVDGFAGPGEYSGGEPGSPIIAMRALKEHAARGKISAQVVFLFVERDTERADHLRRLVETERATLPLATRVHVMTGTFDQTMTALLDDRAGTGRGLAPTFIMADPFGVSDTPLSVIEWLTRHDKSEVYISFMYEAISRFRATPEFAPHLDALFGCPDWRAGIDITDADRKKDFFFSLYRDRLKAAGATQVIHFELYQRNRLVYAIFFGSKHLLGSDRMKQAIWNVAPFGDFAFRGARGGQLGLELGGPNLERFGRELRDASVPGVWIPIEQLQDFSRSDRTDFHSSHLNTTLKILEESGVLSVDPESRKKAKTYPPGTKVRFA